MRRADQQWLGTELVCQPHAEPLAADADPHNLPDCLIGEARGAPKGGHRLLRARTPGADPMWFAAATKLVLCARRTECRCGKHDRDCREASCEEAATTESEA